MILHEWHAVCSGLSMCEELPAELPLTRVRVSEQRSWQSRPHTSVCSSTTLRKSCHLTCAAAAIISGAERSR